MSDNTAVVYVLISFILVVGGNVALHSPLMEAIAAYIGCVS